jgi:hypothetical protein
MSDHDPQPGPSNDEESTMSEQYADTDTTTDEPTTAQGFAAGRHPVNVLHLVMGVAFLGMFVIWALVQSSTAEASDLRWLLPIPWVLAGLAGLVATAPRLRGARD